MKFFIFGHSNILGTHKNTFEFTKDSSLTRNGDCIIGVKSEFLVSEIKNLLNYDKIKITISIDNLIDVVYAEMNKVFSDEHEIVVRIGDHNSSRTLGVMADKAAKDIDRRIINKLKNPEARAMVEIEAA